MGTMATSTTDKHFEEPRLTVSLPKIEIILLFSDTITLVTCAICWG